MTVIVVRVTVIITFIIFSVLNILDVKTLATIRTLNIWFWFETSKCHELTMCCAKPQYSLLSVIYIVIFHCRLQMCWGEVMSLVNPLLGLDPTYTSTLAVITCTRNCPNGFSCVQ